MPDVDDTNRGFSLIEVLTVLAVMTVLAAIALLVVGVNPKRAANEAAAIAAVRALITAEKVYWTDRGRMVYGDLAELNAAKLIDDRLASGHKSGYQFVINKLAPGFEITANPTSVLNGSRSFYADDTGIIRGKAGTGAGAGDPPIGQ